MKKPEAIKNLLPRLLVGVILISVIAGCSLPTGGDSQAVSDLALTQTVISIQQTQTAMGGGVVQVITATGEPQAATEIPVTLPPPPPEDTPVPPLNELPQATLPPSTPEGPSGDSPTFEEWMKVANILAYEDIIYHEKLVRYVRETLRGMDLNYTFVGSAIGEFKKKLLLEAPPGGWDLIIAANEAKIPPVLKGEYFDYLNDALEQGTPVILEVHYLDRVSEGSIEPILEKCGVEYEKNWKDVSSRNQIMWPLEPEHPILNVPNSNLSFTRTTGTWALNYDIGDLMKIGYGGDARFLLGLSSGNDQMHGTLTTCMGDHLILQTYSSHQIDEDVSLDLWENYIYNALKVRYADLYP
jgi:hypothetical protein